METEQQTITRQEFINRFKYEHALLRRDPDIIKSYKTYAKAVRKLRSDLVRYLKGLGVSGVERGEYNDVLQKLARYGHKEYLYFKNPRCGICHYPIVSIADVTIDHIIPTSKGGPNTLTNKQIAHGPCNVQKSDKVL